ncbi:Hypothetical protein POVR2_LOCUS95 [uncultured virus]|nr:Hypothetical protein POVR2_LOCUS95 [uncultured virus]
MFYILGMLTINVVPLNALVLSSASQPSSSYGRGIYDRVDLLMSWLKFNYRQVDVKIGILDDIYRLALDDLDVLIVFLHIFPAIHLEGDVTELKKLNKLVSKIKSLDVLVWFLENEYIEATQANIRTMLLATMYSDNIELVSYLYNGYPSNALVVREVSLNAVQIFKFLDSRLELGSTILLSLQLEEATWLFYKLY